MGIPAVVGLGNITAEVSGGDTVIIDGGRGGVIVNPDEEQRDAHGAVVHVHPLLVPGHGARQRVEQLVRRGDEAQAQIDPGAIG